MDGAEHYGALAPQYPTTVWHRLNQRLPAHAPEIVLLTVLAGVVGLVTLERTGFRLVQVAAILLYLVVFAWLFATAERQSPRVLAAFLFAWAMHTVASFTARTGFLMGSDVHREYRAILVLGDAPHWNPLALQEISFSSAWLMLGTRMLAGVAGVDAFWILKFVVPAILAALALPLFYLFAHLYGTPRAFAATFLTTSLMSFWAVTAQIMKASVSMTFIALLLFAIVRLDLAEQRTFLVSGVLLTGLIMTHYTSSMLFLLVLGPAWLAEVAYRRKLRPGGDRGSVLDLRRMSDLLGLGILVYALWYGSIPYVSSMMENALSAPVEAMLEKVLGEGETQSHGQTVGDALGDRNTAGYMTLRASLMLVALGLALGWARETRRMFTDEAFAPARARLVIAQSTILGLTAAGFLLPIHLDTNRLFAIALIMGASLPVVWWRADEKPISENSASGKPIPWTLIAFVEAVPVFLLMGSHLYPSMILENRLPIAGLILFGALAAAMWDVERRSRTEARAQHPHTRAVLLAGVVLVAASQVGIPFWALDGHAFSANLGDDGPVFDTYGIPEEAESLQAWVTTANLWRPMFTSPNLEDYLQESPSVRHRGTDALPQDAEAQRLAAHSLSMDAGDQLVCVGVDEGAPPPHYEGRIYDSGRTLVLVRCPLADGALGG